MKKTILTILFAAGIFSFITCRRCKMCKECQFDPLTGGVTTNCTQSKKYCGDDLKLVEKASTFICE